MHVGEWLNDLELVTSEEAPKFMYPIVWIILVLFALGVRRWLNVLELAKQEVVPKVPEPMVRVMHVCWRGRGSLGPV